MTADDIAEVRGANCAKAKGQTAAEIFQDTLERGAHCAATSALARARGLRLCRHRLVTDSGGRNSLRSRLRLVLARKPERSGPRFNRLWSGLARVCFTP
jgi:hypothetical protein